MTSAEELLAKAMINGLNKIEKALDTKPDGEDPCDECDEEE